jgi:hypothetical protein
MHVHREKKSASFFYLKSASLLPGIVGLVSHSNRAGKHWGAGQAIRKKLASKVVFYQRRKKITLEC